MPTPEYRRQPDTSQRNRARPPPTPAMITRRRSIRGRNSARTTGRFRELSDVLA